MAGIVIIGGGVTGLSAGIHLLADSEQAHRVTVCERHTVPGGNLTGWVRGDCYIDNCVHWLVGTNPATALYREWVKLGALDGAEIRHPDSLYTCRLDGEEIALWRDAARVERAMLWYSPADGREIRRLFRAVRALQSLSGLTGGAGLLRRTAAGLPELAVYARLTTGELAQRFRHPLLRQFLTAVCDTSFSALAQLAVMAQFCAGNADLPAGGSAAMAERMAARFRSLGGVLRLGAEADSIDLSGTGGIRRACGERGSCTFRRTMSSLLPIRQRSADAYWMRRCPPRLPVGMRLSRRNAFPPCRRRLPVRPCASDSPAN